MIPAQIEAELEQMAIDEIVRSFSVNRDQLIQRQTRGGQLVPCEHQAALVDLWPDHPPPFGPTLSVVDLCDRKLCVAWKDRYGNITPRYYFAGQCPDCGKVHFARESLVRRRK